jgi:hypothetical protein
VSLIARLALLISAIKADFAALAARVTTLEGGSGGGGGGNGISILTFHADLGTTITLTNQANALQGLGNNGRNECYFDATNFTQVRVCARLVTSSASPNSPRLYPQYFDGLAWVTVGTGAGSQSVSMANPTGNKRSDWITIPAGGKADVIWRIAQDGGDGVADPALGATCLQFR